MFNVILSFLAVYDREDGRSRRDTDGCWLYGHGEGKYTIYMYCLQL